MLNRIRSAFRSGDRETMLVVGLSTTTVGILAASGGSDEGISLFLGTAVAGFGLLVLVGTVVWGSDERT